MTSKAKQETIPEEMRGVTGTMSRFQFKSASWWSGPWWLVLAKGIMAITMGIFAWAWPGPTLWVLFLIFGIFAITDGIFTIIMSSTHRKAMKGWGWTLTAGIFGATIGFLLVFWPFATGLVFLIFIAAWMMLTGMFSIVNAASHRKEMPNWGWPLATGIFAIVFSILIIANPLAGAVALIWIWGTFGIVYGTLMCIQAYRTRRTIKAEESQARAE